MELSLLTKIKINTLDETFIFIINIFEVSEITISKMFKNEKKINNES